MTNKYQASEKVWQGVLVMARHPEVVALLGENYWGFSEPENTGDIAEYRAHTKKKLKEMGLKQCDLDAVVRAISWAKNKSAQSR